MAEAAMHDAADSPRPMPPPGHDREHYLLEQQISALWHLGRTTSQQIAQLVVHADRRDREIHDVTRAISSLEHAVQQHVCEEAKRDKVVDDRLLQFATAQQLVSDRMLQLATAQTQMQAAMIGEDGQSLLKTIRDAQIGRKWVRGVMTGTSGAVVAAVSTIAAAAVIVRWLVTGAAP